MRRQRFAKIIATLGPATSDAEMIRALFMAGVDVFRLNFSHGSHADHRRSFEAIRALETEIGRPIGILVDLQGPKLRIGKFLKGHALLEEGDLFRLDLDPSPGDRGRVSLPHPQVFAALAPKAHLLVNDGRIRLEVEKCGSDFAQTRVLTKGEISDHKGVNLPGAFLPLSPLTDKDREDLELGLDLGADWIGASFIQQPQDLLLLREAIKDRAGLITKFEKPTAVDRLEEIIELSDAIMVARGDLGVELPPEDVPSISRRIVRASRDAGKPVIVATQMLESMISAPIPTRAEASDVASAIYDGADAVMLSGETATGDYPVETATMMHRIISRVEQDPYYRKMIDIAPAIPESTTADAICDAMRRIVQTLEASVAVTYTKSGSSSLRAARERPDAPILSLTPHRKTARHLTLAWGIHSALGKEVESVEEMVSQACDTALSEGFAAVGDRIVIMAGIPFGVSGTTNLMRIARVKAPKSA
ncbi:MAG: pyruvate kinase [Ectothiorhodospiraceae bacterium AqS1]|nr:pyruvate kinase [Ectothiorhodospiraceae bacterium AqS1]